MKFTIYIMLKPYKYILYKNGPNFCGHLLYDEHLLLHLRRIGFLTFQISQPQLEQFADTPLCSSQSQLRIFVMNFKDFNFRTHCHCVQLKPSSRFSVNKCVRWNHS